MKARWLLAGWIAVLLGLASCERSATSLVTQYGPRYMTCEGSGGEFNDACRQVLQELGVREETGDNSVRYPHHAEGVSSHKDGERRIATESYISTRDEDGAEYKITTLRLGDRDPVVILESTASDPYKLVNALNAEFGKRGIRVVQYDGSH